jgi:hypothetical protein
MFAAISAMVAAGQQALVSQLPSYQSRGKGEGCAGNKRAKSSFKQNKRRGL